MLQARYRDAETVNSLRLLDTLKDYETFKSGTATIDAAQEGSGSAAALHRAGAATARSRFTSKSTR